MHDLRVPPTGTGSQSNELPDPAMVKIPNLDNEEGEQLRSASAKSTTLTKLLRHGVIIEEDDPILEHQSSFQMRESNNGQYVETLGNDLLS